MSDMLRFKEKFLCLFVFISYSQELEIEDAIHTAILTMKEGFEGIMSSTNVEIGVAIGNQFHILTPEDISEYLTNIA